MSEFPDSIAEIERSILARMPETGIVPDLGRITALLDLLGNPQRSFKSVHITGTNGKTSTTRMVDALLRAHDLRVGRFTSPHLHHVSERIGIDGAPISDEQFVRAYREVAPMVEVVDGKSLAEGGSRVTYFEFITALAFAAFADAPVEVAAIEVGLGGSWDATNVVHAPVAVIAPIDLDHTSLLGKTVGSIATEKAGIIYDGATAIIATQPDEAVRPILERVRAVEATIAREGSEFGVVRRELAVGGQLVSFTGLGGHYDNVFVPLHGAHQAQNAALALAAVEAFLGAGIRDGVPHSLDVETVRQGFAMADSPGRLERLRTSPTVLVDAAHNPAGLSVTLRAVAESFGFQRLIVVFSAFRDKDVRSMLGQLEPAVDQIVVTQNSAPRAMDVDELAARAVEMFGEDRVEVAPRMDDAIDAAVRLAEESMESSPLGSAGVLITGSIATAADARKLLSQ